MKLSALFDTPVALWRLNRDGHTIVAEVHEIEGIGLELRYMRDRETAFVWMRFRNGIELLREAAMERFELEA
jgi:hypothetical protein